MGTQMRIVQNNSFDANAKLLNFSKKLKTAGGGGLGKGNVG